MVVLLLAVGLQSCELPQNEKTSSKKSKKSSKKKSTKKKKKGNEPAPIEEISMSSYLPRLNESPLGSRSKEEIPEIEVDADKSGYINNNYQGLSMNQRKMVDQINAYRVKGCTCAGQYFKPVAPLRVNSKLTRTASYHASDMKNKRRLSHKGRNGQGMATRIKSDGYNYQEASQNITNNSSAPGEALVYLMRNPKNCANIMRAEFTDIGIGQAGTYWTQLFAKPIINTFPKDPFYKTQTVSYSTNSAFRNEMLREVNSIRTKGCYCGKKYYEPVQPLSWNTKLEKSSYLHSRDMARRKTLTHTGGDGSDIGKRVERVGYNYKSAGENVSVRKYSLKSAVQGWKKSPKHCINMMRAEFTEMGAAEFEHYWTQNFGMQQR